MSDDDASSEGSTVPVELDLATEAGAIWSTLQAAYAVEAELLELSDFQPLLRTEDDLRLATSRFFGLRFEGELAGVLELDDATGATPVVASLAVHPRHHRRGVATRLLEHVVDRIGSRSLHVSTAARNAPALALYERAGFRARERWTSPNGLAMVTLERRCADD